MALIRFVLRIFFFCYRREAPVFIEAYPLVTTRPILGITLAMQAKRKLNPLASGWLPFALSLREAFAFILLGVCLPASCLWRIRC